MLERWHKKEPRRGSISLKLEIAQSEGNGAFSAKFRTRAYYACSFSLLYTLEGSELTSIALMEIMREGEAGEASD